MVISYVILHFVNIVLNDDVVNLVSERGKAGGVGAVSPDS